MLNFNHIDDRWKAKNHSNDRILVLKVKEGMSAKNTLGVLDPRLFNQENNLHVKCNQNYHWYFEYETRGKIPQQLDQKFTTFSKAKEFATIYFNKRNIEIVDVIDHYAVH